MILPKIVSSLLIDLASRITAYARPRRILAEAPLRKLSAAYQRFFRLIRLSMALEAVSCAGALATWARVVTYGSGFKLPLRKNATI